MATARKKSSVLATTTYNCDSSVQVGDFIAIGPGGDLILAKANGLNTMPSIGIVISKSSATQCKITDDFLEEGLTGIINRKKYFISIVNAGKLQESVPQAPNILQPVAQGLGTTKRKVSIDPTVFIVRT